MANLCFVIAIVVVATCYSLCEQIQNIANINNFLNQILKNDNKEAGHLDENKRGVQEQWLLREDLKEGLKALINVKEELNKIENIIKQDVKKQQIPVQPSFLSSQIQKPESKLHIYNPNIFFPEIIERLENNTSAYDDWPKRRHQDKNQQSNFLTEIIEKVQNDARLFDKGEPAPALRRTKRLARNPKDMKGKRKRKRKAQKRRTKRKKERIKKHMMRLKKQQADKLKRKEKFKMKTRLRQNRTKEVEEEDQADPNYDEVYDMSVPEKKVRKDSEEEYAHYNDPIPGTYEMDSDDWRHVKYTIREKNSSECSKAWFDDIDISNMTDSEVDRRFPTQEGDSALMTSEYRDSVSQKVKDIQNKQLNMMNKRGKQSSSEDDKDSSSKDKESSDDDDSYDDGGGEDEGGGDDDDYDGSDDYDIPEDNKQSGKAGGDRNINKDEKASGKQENNKNLKSKHKHLKPRIKKNKPIMNKINMKRVFKNRKQKIKLNKRINMKHPMDKVPSISNTKQNEKPKVKMSDNLVGKSKLGVSIDLPNPDHHLKDNGKSSVGNKEGNSQKILKPLEKGKTYTVSGKSLKRKIGKEIKNQNELKSTKKITETNADDVFNKINAKNKVASENIIEKKNEIKDSLKSFLNPEKAQKSDFKINILGNNEEKIVNGKPSEEVIHNQINLRNRPIARV